MHLRARMLFAIGRAVAREALDLRGRGLSQPDREAMPFPVPLAVDASDLVDELGLDIDVGLGRKRRGRGNRSVHRMQAPIPWQRYERRLRAVARLRRRARASSDRS